MEIQRTNSNIKFTDSSFDLSDYDFDSCFGFGSGDLNQQLNRKSNQNQKKIQRMGDHENKGKMLSDRLNLNNNKNTEGYLTKIFKNLKLNNYLFNESQFKFQSKYGETPNTSISIPKTNTTALNIKELIVKIFEPTGQDENIIYFIDIFICHVILYQIEGKQVEKMISEEYHRVALIEKKCYWNNLGVKRRLALILNRYDRFQQRGEVEISDRIKTLVIKRETCFDYNPKQFASLLVYAEALKFISFNMFDLFDNKSGAVKRDEFINFYNRLTNIFISQVLEAGNSKDRKYAIKWILKVGQRFAVEGAMNGLNACIAALQCSSVYRLNLIQEQEVKYRKRYAKLAGITSQMNNFAIMRQTAALVPWMGLLMKDYAFIKEMKEGKDEDSKGKTSNFDLVNCFMKVIGSVSESQRACREYLQKISKNQLKSVNELVHCIMTVDIIYESEEEQFSRSLFLFQDQ